ncbi:hypothetical protein Lal_00012659 [Lupinus albus]|nr:hypothetical protein Lal_00012659 [Lupinus albus]
MVLMRTTCANKSLKIINKSTCLSLLIGMSNTYNGTTLLVNSLIFNDGNLQEIKATPKGKCGTDSNHVVTIVGYGRTDDGTKYWLVKNSWALNELELIPLISSDFSFPQYLHYNSLILLHATEEAAIINLLNFIYTNTLGTTSPRAVLDVLKANDKF